MKFHLLKIFLVLSLIAPPVFCADKLFLLNDRCTQDLYTSIFNYFDNFPQIEAIRDIRGITLRFELKTPEDDYTKLEPDIRQKIKIIQYFLAKIKNPVIIEVHTEKIPEQYCCNLKNWEFSTVVANNIQDIFVKEEPRIHTERIYTVGYGEFMPAGKNTPNNGSNYSNRVDIIILCSMSGE